jgi:hypothetical protein
MMIRWLEVAFSNSRIGRLLRAISTVRKRHKLGRLQDTTDTEQEKLDDDILIKERPVDREVGSAMVPDLPQHIPELAHDTIEVGTVERQSQNSR